MAVWDTDSEGKVVERNPITTFERDVLVVTNVGQCVAAIGELSNEQIMMVVDDLLKVMDDDDLYREWAKKVSDGYRYEYETN